MRTIDEWLEENKSKLGDYNWVACDKDGRWFVYSEKPSVQENSTSFKGIYWSSFFVIKEKLKPFEDWRNSLRRIEDARD